MWIFIVSEEKMNISDLIKRYFHSRGHGVHSPLAYRIIKDCLGFYRGETAYYSDAYAAEECDGDRLTFKTSMFAVRLIHLLDAKTIWIPGHSGKRILRTIRRAYPERKVESQDKFPKNTDFIVFFNEGGFDFEGIPESKQDCAILTVPSLKDFGDISKKFGTTLAIKSRWFTLLCRREMMDYTEYDIL